MTVHEEFLVRLLEEIKRYFNIKNVIQFDGNELIVHKQSIVCPDKCRRVTDCDRLENLVNVDDGYLMKAFQPFLTETKFLETTKKPTLYEQSVPFYIFLSQIFIVHFRITKITKSLFPAQNIIEKILIEILERRFKVSGQIVKNLLITENNLERHFEFLTRIYLFKDDFMFFFHQRLFRQVITHLNSIT